MEASKMKNMVVLKNLPSNLVEEAIVILKSNKHVKKLEKIEKQGENLIINFSKEFNKISEMDNEEKQLVMDSIKKTVTQLTEINSVEIYINEEKVF